MLFFAKDSDLEIIVLDYFEPAKNLTLLAK